MNKKLGLQHILQDLHTTRKRLLEDAELAMPTDKFPAFRKRLLDELGQRGLEKKLLELDRYGDGRE